MLREQCLKLLLAGACGFMFSCNAEVQKPATMVADNINTVAAIKPVVVEGTVDSGNNALLVSLSSAHAEFEPGVDVELIFTVNNLSPHSVELLPWRTPLEAVPSADMFDVRFEDKLLPYMGRMVKRAPPVSSDYITLAADEKMQVSVNLSQAYDTGRAGRYSIQLKSKDGFFKIHPANARISTDLIVINRL